MIYMLKRFFFYEDLTLYHELYGSINCLKKFKQECESYEKNSNGLVVNILVNPDLN